MKIMFGISFCSLKLLSIDLFFKDTLPVNSIIQVAQCTMYVANQLTQAYSTLLYSLGTYIVAQSLTKPHSCQHS